MTEEKGLAVLEKRAVTPEIWHMIVDMAPVMWSSRLFGVSSKESAAAIMLKGFEMGIPLTASFELIHVVQGKPSLSPRGAMALLLNAPEIKKIDVRRMTDDKGGYVGHECTMERSNGFSYTVRFTLQDAGRAGLIKQDSGWQNYPENMCQWRAIGFCADVVAPDITAGLTGLMKMPERFGVALTQDGDVIDGTSVSFAAVSEPETPTMAKTPAPTLDDLVNQYGAEAILVANEGRVPATDDEVAAVAAKLVAK